jgi:hypothetical protein
MSGMETIRADQKGREALVVADLVRPGAIVGSDIGHERRLKGFRPGLCPAE